MFSQRPLKPEWTAVMRSLATEEDRLLAKRILVVLTES